MQLTIQLPEATERRLRDRAKAEHVSTDSLASNLLIGAIDRIEPKSGDLLDEWIDHEYHAECEALSKADESDEDNIEEVRRILSKIPGNWSDDIIVDREDR